MNVQGDNDEIEIRDQSGDPFTAVWNWMLDRSDLTNTEKLVWIALKSYAGCREIRPSVQTVARRASVGIRTAQRCFDVLTGKGLIRVERRTRPDGGFATNRYILLPSPREIKHKEVGAVVAPTPPVMVTPTPGDNMAPPQVSQRHQENIKLIKNNTTTPLLAEKKPEKSIPKVVAHDDGRAELPDKSKTGAEVVVVDDIKKLTKGTPFEKVNEQSLRMFATKYGSRHVFDSLDMLIATYKIRGKVVKDPMAVLAIGLLKGVTRPSDYVPYHLRIENERKSKEAAERKRIAEAQKKKAEEEDFSNKAAEFDALPEEDREQWLNRARAKMHPSLKTSTIATRSIAISLFRGG
jgi:hypothetical protein